jgi:hypothetical protein
MESSGGQVLPGNKSSQARGFAFVAVDAAAELL